MLSRRFTKSNGLANLILFCCLLATSTSAFTFNYDWASGSQCGPVSVSYNPSEVVGDVTAIWMPVLNEPIVVRSGGSNAGVLRTTLSFQAGSRYVLLLKDSTGIGGGGTSVLATVPGSSNISCLSNSNPPFIFYFASAAAPVQCGGFEMVWSGSAVGSVNFTVVPVNRDFIPFNLIPPSSAQLARRYTWTTNLTSGTEFMIMANDGADYGNGGMSDILQVQRGNNVSSCLGAGAMSQAPIASMTGMVASRSTGLGTGAGTGTNRASATAGSSSFDSSSKLSGGAVAGIVLGVLIPLVILGLILIYFLLRRRRNASEVTHPGRLDLTADNDMSEAGGGGHIEPYMIGLREEDAESFRNSGVAGVGAGRLSRGESEAGLLSTRGSFTEGDMTVPSSPIMSQRRESLGVSTTAASSAKANEAFSHRRTTTRSSIPLSFYVSNPTETNPSSPLPRSPTAGRSEADADENVVEYGVEETFVRHTDAVGTERRNVELPPLYSDVPGERRGGNTST